MFGFMMVYSNGFVAIDYTDNICDALTLCTAALYNRDCYHVEIWRTYTDEIILDFTCSKYDIKEDA